MDKKMDKEYAGIAGLSEFVKESTKLAYGDNSPGLINKQVH